MAAHCARNMVEYDKNILPTAEQKRFAWYVNQKAVFKATEWENYRKKTVLVILNFYL
jgi:hypothetical protein